MDGVETRNVAEMIDRMSFLREQKDGLKSTLKDVDGELGPLEQQIVQRMQEDSQQQIKQSGISVYLRREIALTRKSEDPRPIIEAFIKAGHTALLGINWPGLKAFSKEEMKDESTNTWEVRPDLLPDVIENNFTVSEMTKLGVRRSS